MRQCGAVTLAVGSKFWEGGEEASEHSGDLGGEGLAAVQEGGAAEMQAASNDQLCLKFGVGTFRNAQELLELAWCASTFAFGYVARDRDGSSAELRGETEKLVTGERTGKCVDGEAELYGTPPDDEIAEGTFRHWSGLSVVHCLSLHHTALYCLTTGFMGSMLQRPDQEEAMTMLSPGLARS